MSGVADDWEGRVAELWTQLDQQGEADFVAKIEALAAERPAGDAAALFERACAQDSTGHSDKAVSLYHQALDTGLVGLRRRRAVIQLASSLRNLGQPRESVALLTEERARGSDELDDAVVAVLALALTDLGEAREAVSMTVTALARHLPRYNRSMANYAKALLGQD